MKWIFAGALLLLVACGKDPSAPKSADVEASGKDAIAAGRDVVIDKNTVINEYDTDKARKIEAQRFARGMNRECTAYLGILRGLALKREKGESSVAMMPGIFSPAYASPETQRVLGDEAYRKLNSQQAELRDLHGQMFKMRQQYVMASAFQMAAQYDKRPKAQEFAAKNPAPTEEEFAETKSALTQKAEAHCAFLSSLM